jgi:hypothetical protein
LYQNILSRDSDIQGGIDYWTEHTRFHGISSTIVGFFTSDEFKAKNFPQEVVVDKLYHSILGREGRGDGKNYWLDRLRRGDTTQMIVNDFVGSAEYRQKVGEGVVPPPGMFVYPVLIYLWKISLLLHHRPIFIWKSDGRISDFIRTLYQNILTRDLEIQGGIDYWTEHTRFHGIASTISGFFTSDEFKAKNLAHEIIVNKLYRSILGREGENDEKNYWLGRLRRGDAIQMVINDCVGSAEYRQKALQGVVPPPGMSVYPSCVPLSMENLTAIPSDLYLHANQMAEYLISLERCIRTSSIVIWRFKGASITGQNTSISTELLQPSADSSPLMNSRPRTFLRKLLWINYIAQF